MGAHDAASAARAKMAQVQREMAERRALRDRNARDRRGQALESFRKQGPMVEQVAKRLGELGRRRAQAGGWATEKTEKDKDAVLSFGPEDEEHTGDDPYAFLANMPRPQDDPPGGIGAIEDEDGPLVEDPPPAPAPEEPAPPATPPRPAAAVRRPVPEHSELDDEDDFSNQSSWMRNQ